MCLCRSLGDPGSYAPRGRERLRPGRVEMRAEYLPGMDRGGGDVRSRSRGGNDERDAAGHRLSVLMRAVVGAGTVLVTFAVGVAG